MVGVAGFERDKRKTQDGKIAVEIEAFRARGSSLNKEPLTQPVRRSLGVGGWLRISQPPQ